MHFNKNTYKKLNESAFNLRRVSKTNDIDFDNDEVSAEDVKRSLTKFKLLKIVKDIIDGEANQKDKIFFKTHYLDYTDTILYKVKSKEELKYIITYCCDILGFKCNLNWLDVSSITDMSSLFHDDSFNGDISDWDVSHVTNMAHMFDSSKFNGDISKWDVSNVRLMHYMFYYSDFDGDISMWDTSNVTDMHAMFWTSKFTGDISKWDVSKVQNMGHMFYCYKFNLNIGDWDVRSVTTMEGMFMNSLFNGDISKWDVSHVGIMYSMFWNSEFNKDISAWKTANVTDMSHMFLNSKFNQDISSWQIQSECDIEDMFEECLIKEEFKPKALLKLTESAFNLRRDSKTSDIEFDNDEVSAEDIHKSEIKHRLEALVYKMLNFKMTNQEAEFFKTNCSIFDDEPFYTVNSRKELQELVKQCVYALGTDCDLNWINVSLLKSLGCIFEFSKFNGDISKWDTSNVTSMFCTFASSDFNGDISNWDTSNVTEMSTTFEYSKFNGDISEWDVRKVKNMGAMFEHSEFNGDISKWQPLSAMNMSAMFRSSKFNQDISDWDVRSVTGFSEMFYMSPFNQDIHTWKISNKAVTENMFANCPINEEFKPKTLLKLSESAFNLQKNNKVSNIEFDDDEVSLEDIENKKQDFFEKCILGLLDDTITPELIKRFLKYTKCIKHPIYKVEYYALLDNIIRQSIKYFGNECDLNWIDVSIMSDMSQLFLRNSNFNGDISKWDVRAVKYMKNMFTMSLFNGDISKWDVSNVIDAEYMFYAASLFNSDISDWKLTSVKNTKFMFSRCPIREEFKPKALLNLSESAFNLRKDSKTSDVEFDNDEVSVEDIETKKKDFFKRCIQRLLDDSIMSLDVKSFSKYIKHIKRPIYKVTTFEQLDDIICQSIKYLGNECDLNWIDVSSITNMSTLFFNSKNFNGDISKWDTSNVTDMSYMFYDSKFNGDISKWDVSKVKDMSCMFAESEFNQDISDWKPSLPTKHRKIFYKCPIEKEFKPKALLKISESAFNLRRDARTSSIEFDNDEVPAENILRSEAKFRILKLVPKLLDDSITKEEVSYFIDYYTDFDDKPFYKVKDKEELSDLITKCIHYLSETCDLNWIDVSDITNMSRLFAKMEFDLEKAKHETFNGDISLWDVSNVTDMVGMFYKSEFNQDISKWDVSNVVNMRSMFALSKFNQDISKWDVSNVQDMSYMFYVAEKFNSPIGNWDVSSVLNMCNMFEESKFNQDISKWDVSNVTAMAHMFTGSHFNKSIRDWNVANVRNMESMFAYTSFNKDISNWEIDQKAYTANMFSQGAIKEKFKPKSLLELSESAFNLRKDTRISNIEFDNDEVEAKDIQHTETKYRLQTLVPKILDETATNDEISYFIDHYIEFDDEPFYKVKNRDELNQLITTCIRALGATCSLNWLDVSGVTDMSDLFYKSVFDILRAEHETFNGDISKWDTSNVTNMSGMFYESNFNGDISKWDTSNVTTMHHMFTRAQFNGDISKWDVSKVQNMAYMFCGCKTFNTYIGDWDVRSVDDMSHMFEQSEFNSDISGWDVTEVCDFSSMFAESSFRQDISNWNIKNQTTFNMFFGCYIEESFKPKALQD